jgi:hypothetical protein
LVPLEACMVILDRDEDDLLALIEGGFLRWVWDIRSPQAERRELRVWRGSVLAYAERKTTEHLLLKEADVYESLLPGRRDDLRSTELQRLFSASQTHIQHLIDNRLLPAVGHGGAGTMRPLHGPNSFTRVKRAEVIAFLRSRSLQAKL